TYHLNAVGLKRRPLTQILSHHEQKFGQNQIRMTVSIEANPPVQNIVRLIEGSDTRSQRADLSLERRRIEATPVTQILSHHEQKFGQNHIRMTVSIEANTPVQNVVRLISLERRRIEATPAHTDLITP